MWISYRTLIAVWYCPVVMGKKTTGMGKKTHRNSMWISYRTLIAVWCCPVVMGKKNHRNGQKKPQEQYVDFLWHINCCVVLSCGNGQKNPQEWAKNHRNGQKTHRNIMWYFLWYINCCVVLSCGNGEKTQEYAVVFPMDSMWYFLWFRCVVFPQNTTRYFRQGRFLEWNKIYKK